MGVRLGCAGLGRNLVHRVEDGAVDPLDDGHDLVAASGTGRLAAGALDIRVRWLDRDEIFEVDTPNQAFWVTEPGRYRVEASEDGTYTVVSVREGEGESTGNGQNYALHAGQRWTFSGTDQLTADAAQIGDPDEFDNWAYGRERRFDDSRSAQYVSRDVVGYDDLDDYGEWRDDSQYGHVWFPQQVGAGWAPYRAGHWDWIVPWGWTWVDDAPWGYAPFHYGRWVFVGQRWGWVAGPPSVRSVYAPALVVFLGSGGGFGENVGWFPLAPHGQVLGSSVTSKTKYCRPPPNGMNATAPGADRVREATPADVPAMAALEMEVSGITREQDYRYAIENKLGFWHAAVYENEDGKLDGFMISSLHHPMNMLGPCVARSEAEAAALIVRELDVHRGRTPWFVVPAGCGTLVRQLYDWGAHNCELHLCHVRGEFQPFRGVSMPTFLPETG